MPDSDSSPSQNTPPITPKTVPEHGTLNNRDKWSVPQGSPVKKQVWPEGRVPKTLWIADGEWHKVEAKLESRHATKILAHSTCPCDLSFQAHYICYAPSVCQEKKLDVYIRADLGIGAYQYLVSKCRFIRVFSFQPLTVAFQLWHKARCPQMIRLNLIRMTSTKPPSLSRQLSQRTMSTNSQSRTSNWAGRSLLKPSSKKTRISRARSVFRSLQTY